MSIKSPITSETEFTYLSDNLTVDYKALGSLSYFTAYSGLSEKMQYGCSKFSFYIQWKNLCVILVFNSNYSTATIKGPNSIQGIMDGLTAFSGVTDAVHINLKGLTEEQREVLVAYESWDGYYLRINSGPDINSVYRIHGFNSTYDLFNFYEPLNNDITDDTELEIVKKINPINTWVNVPLRSFSELLIYLNSLNQKGILDYPTGDISLTEFTLQGYDIKYAVLEDSYLKDKRLSTSLTKVTSYTDLFKKQAFNLKNITIADEPSHDFWNENLISNIYNANTSVEILTGYSIVYNSSLKKITITFSGAALTQDNKYYVKYSNGMVFIATAGSTTVLTYIWEQLVGIHEKINQIPLISSIKQSIITKDSSYKNTLQVYNTKALPGKVSIITLHIKHLSTSGLTLDVALIFNANGRQQIKIFEIGNPSNVYGYVEISTADLVSSTFEARFSDNNTTYLFNFNIATVAIQIKPHDTQIDLVEQANPSNVIATIDIPAALIYGDMSTIVYYFDEADNTFFMHNDNVIFKVSLLDGQFKIIKTKIVFLTDGRAITYLAFKPYVARMDFLVYSETPTPSALILDTNFNTASYHGYYKEFRTGSAVNISGTALYKRMFVAGAHKYAGDLLSVHADFDMIPYNSPHSIIGYSAASASSMYIYSFNYNGVVISPSSNTALTRAGTGYFNTIGSTGSERVYDFILNPYNPTQISEPFNGALRIDMQLPGGPTVPVQYIPIRPGYDVNIAEVLLRMGGVSPGEVISEEVLKRIETEFYLKRVGRYRYSNRSAVRKGTKIYIHETHHQVDNITFWISSRSKVGVYDSTIEGYVWKPWKTNRALNWGTYSQTSYSFSGNWVLDLETGIGYAGAAPSGPYDEIYYSSGGYDVNYPGTVLGTVDRTGSNKIIVMLGITVTSNLINITQARATIYTPGMAWPSTARPTIIGHPSEQDHLPITFGQFTNEFSKTHANIVTDDVENIASRYLNEDLSSLRIVQTPPTSSSTTSNTTNPVEITIPSGYKLLFLNETYTYNGATITTEVTGAGNYLILAHLDPHTQTITEFITVRDDSPSLEDYGEYYVPIKTISI